MLAAIYARYSTENQDAASPEGQERVCRAHAERLGHAVVNVYTDAGISGTTTNRPGLQRMLADAAGRKFKAVIVADISRLSRNLRDQLNITSQLTDLGVTVLDADTGADSDNEASELILAMKGMVSGEYVKAVRIATPSGLGTRSPGTWVV